MATNDQYRPGQTPFGMSDAIAHTGASGSVGVGTGEGDSPLLSVPVSPVFDSVQGLAPRTVAVGTGDTSGFSDDTPIHQSPLLPHGEEALTTGSGQGHARGSGHPNRTGGATAGPEV